jgi:hypothetical protein
MSSKPWSIRPHDVRRLLSGIELAGWTAARLLYRRDGLEVLALKPGEANEANGHGKFPEDPHDDEDLSKLI